MNKQKKQGQKQTNKSQQQRHETNRQKINIKDIVEQPWSSG